VRSLQIHRKTRSRQTSALQMVAVHRRAERGGKRRKETNSSSSTGSAILVHNATVGYTFRSCAAPVGFRASIRHAVQQGSKSRIGPRRALRVRNEAGGAANLPACRAWCELRGREDILCPILLRAHHHTTCTTVPNSFALTQAKASQYMKEISRR